MIAYIDQFRPTQRKCAVNGFLTSHHVDILPSPNFYFSLPFLHHFNTMVIYNHTHIQSGLANLCSAQAQNIPFTVCIIKFFQIHI